MNGKHILTLHRGLLQSWSFLVILNWIMGYNLDFHQVPHQMIIMDGSSILDVQHGMKKIFVEFLFYDILSENFIILNFYGFVALRVSRAPSLGSKSHVFDLLGKHSKMNKDYLIWHIRYLWRKVV